MSNKTKNSLYKLSIIALFSGVSAVTLTACDRTEPDEAVASNQVEIEQTSPLTAGESVGESNIKAVEGTVSDAGVINDNDNDSDVALSEPTIVVSDVSKIMAGTPEATLKEALNTIYYGNASDAAVYYDTDIANFEQQLAETQALFQKTVEKVTITSVNYNEDKTEATLSGTISLVDIEQPDQSEFKLKKVDGEWKLLG